MVHECRQDSAHAVRMRAAKGRPIFEQGGPAHPAFVIEDGCVSLSTTDPGGRRVVVTFLFSGDTLCAGVHDTWASAVAVTDCILRRVPIAQTALRRSAGFPAIRTPATSIGGSEDGASRLPSRPP